MSAMSSSLSRTSVSVASMSLTIEWNSDRLLLCCRRMCSSPLERREEGREKVQEGREGDGLSFRTLWSVREVKDKLTNYPDTLTIAEEGAKFFVTILNTLSKIHTATLIFKQTERRKERETCKEVTRYISSTCLRRTVEGLGGDGGHLSMLVLTQPVCHQVMKTIYTHTAERKRCTRIYFIEPWKCSNPDTNGISEGLTRNSSWRKKVSLLERCPIECPD